MLFGWSYSYNEPKTRVFGTKFLNVGSVGFVGDTP